MDLFCHFENKFHFLETFTPPYPNMYKWLFFLVKALTNFKGKKMGKTICLDFDGVINSFTSGWRGEDDIPDLPIFGTRDSINRLRAIGYKIVVHSCRCHSPIGRKAIENYLLTHDIDVDDICEHKPQADYYVDDRAIKFDGVWEDAVGQILEGNDTIQLTWGDFQLMSTNRWKI